MNDEEKTVSALAKAYAEADAHLDTAVRREGAGDVRYWQALAADNVRKARVHLVEFCTASVEPWSDAKFVSCVSALNVALANLHAATAAVNKHAEAIAEAEAAAHAIEAEMICRVLGVQNYDAPPLTDADFVRLLPEGDV